MRVLMIAEMANPEWTSVPLVGWQHAFAIAKQVDAHLITQIRNRDAITRVAGWQEGREFTAIDSEAVAAWIGRLTTVIRGGRNKGWTTATALRTLAYYDFERQLWRDFGKRIRSHEFDIVHRITPLSPTIPSTIAGKCRQAGVPFILGPINGGVPWPRQFDSLRRREREWLSYFRSAYRLLPGYRSTLRHAAALLVGSKDTLAQIPERHRRKCIYMPENAIDPARFAASRTHSAVRPIKVAFIGRLVPYKGADILIEAAADLVRSQKLTLDLFGDGPEMGRLRAKVVQENLTDGVRLAGWVKHEELQHRLVEADVFAFPSIREFGGGVVLEAMACGLAPVVVNYGGPGELVTDQTGFRVPMGSRAQIVAGFKAILSELAAKPAMIDVVSARALRRVREQFTWDAKARQVGEVYRWVLDSRMSKPEFEMPDRAIHPMGMQTFSGSECENSGRDFERPLAGL